MLPWVPRWCCHPASQHGETDRSSRGLPSRQRLPGRIVLMARFRIAVVPSSSSWVTFFLPFATKVPVPEPSPSACVHSRTVPMEHTPEPSAKGIPTSPGQPYALRQRFRREFSSVKSIFTGLTLFLLLASVRVDAVVVGTVGVAVIIGLEFLAIQLQVRRLAPEPVVTPFDSPTMILLNRGRCSVAWFQVCAPVPAITNGPYIRVPTGCLQRSTIMTYTSLESLSAPYSICLLEWLSISDISHLRVLLHGSTPVLG